MKSKLKNFSIPLLLMFLTNLGFYFLTYSENFGGDINPHLGILFIAGIFFGPYGSLGAVLANGICDIIRGYDISSTIVSFIISFSVSYMAYKLWYTKNLRIAPITRPRLNNINSMLYLLFIILISSIIYSLLTTNITGIFYPSIDRDYEFMRYLINFVNFAVFFSLILMIISRYTDFSYTPELSEKSSDDRMYNRLFALIVIMVITSVILNIIFDNNYALYIVETVLLLVLLFVYNQRPIICFNRITYTSISENIMLTSIVFSIIGIVIDLFIVYSPLMNNLIHIFSIISVNQEQLFLMQIIDGIIIILAAPSILLLGFVEKKILKPLLSFSKIEPFIKENEKIESDGLIDIYSDYVDEDNEIGILSRSYTNLIKNNNNYIENVKKLEHEKERINTELNIAHRIQKATLPKKRIDNEDIRLEGFCKPAKEVGGDFYDFYELDEDNTMLIIGDASGKGVPAAIITLITQNSIKLLIKNHYDPAKVLYDVNNQLCENNPEMMFITLFLGVYNRKSHKLTYANAGHDTPIIRESDEYCFMDIDSEIVLGIMEDYEYSNYEKTIDDKLILYTDGITDAQNGDNELFGQERLIKFLNNTASEENTIEELIGTINEFVENEKQFDDMTLLTLTVK